MSSLFNNDDNPGPSPSKARKKATNEFSEGDNGDHNGSCQIMVNNSHNILKVLNDLYHEKEMCDVYLRVGVKEYGAHRIILCASSDVFQIMLLRPEWQEWHESKVELQELPICEPVFPIFLEYFYTGKIMITHTNVMPILALADKYMVKSLNRTCLAYMCKHVPHAAHHNQLFSWLQYSTACGHNELFETCQNYIKWNFEKVANTPDFSNFDLELFIMILTQNDIVVRNETVLYNCVVMWLELEKIKLHQQSSKSNNIDQEFKYLVTKIMSYIRFPMMTPRELADLLLSPVINYNNTFFVERMSLGMKYHTGITDIPGNIKSLFTPRLYTSDNCSALLTIENFYVIPNYHTSTYVFSSCLSAAEHESHKINEWLVDFYPKGIWFKKCFLIGLQGMLEVPEAILSTVRLSITCRELSEANMRVKISLLIYGIQGGIEHVMEVREVVHHFNSRDNTVNIDDVIPFDELNKPASLKNRDGSVYLVGPNRDKVKLNLVIAPIR